jgi:uncharacterized protein
MGDVSNEPSMEHILSSIKRIIAEDGEGAISERRTRGPRAPLAQPVAEDDVLELSEPMSETVTEGEEGMVAPASETIESNEADATSRPTGFSPAAPREELVSTEAASASRTSLDALSRLVVKPDVTGSDTLEGMVREMLRPMLKEWLDENLPRLVESMVSREISRITGR